jgi:hypothetical protein
MRCWFLAAAAATLLTAAMSPAGALPLDPGAVRFAAEAVNPIENTACWRRGWNGWGWYPCGGGAYYGGGPDYYHHWRRPYWHENEYADGEHEWHHRDWR